MNYAKNGENVSALSDHRVALLRIMGRPSFYDTVCCFYLNGDLHIRFVLLATHSLTTPSHSFVAKQLNIPILKHVETN
jgi:hypothetical protein